MVTARTRRALMFLAFAAVPVVALPAPAVRACGAFLSTTTDGNSRIGAQRALYVLGTDRVDLHLQLTGDSSPTSDFAWVFPIPATGGTAGTADGLPTLALSSAALFDTLEDLTAPSVTIERASSGGGGTGCADAKDGLNRGGTDGPVDHFGGGTLGAYTWDILAGRDAAAVVEWLSERGYVLPEGFGDAITPWLASSRFVAVRLTAGALPAAPALEPLVISFDRPAGATLVYPFSLSRLSTAERAPFVVWTLGDRRQRVLNYGSIDVGTVADTMAAEFDLSYNDAVRRLTDASDGRLVVTEFARDIGSFDAPEPLAALIGTETFYLTRLFGDIPRPFMDDLVISHAPNAPDVASEVVVTADAGSFEATRTAGGPLVVFVLWAGLRRVRRERDDAEG